VAGLFFAFFYGLVVKSFDPEFVPGTKGNFIPYSGTLFFTLGALVTTIIFNPIVMRFPVQGDPVTFKQYFAGAPKNHLTGLLGGLIWASGMAVSFMAIKEADPAVGYAISNASPVVAVLWGVFIWKEFKDAPKGTNRILAIMFALFLVALVTIGASKKLALKPDEAAPVDPNSIAASVVAPADNYELPKLIIE
jgi:glucose uptake protein